MNAIPLLQELQDLLEQCFMDPPQGELGERVRLMSTQGLMVHVHYYRDANGVLRAAASEDLHQLVVALREDRTYRLDTVERLRVSGCA